MRMMGFKLGPRLSLTFVLTLGSLASCPGLAVEVNLQRTNLSLEVGQSSPPALKELKNQLQLTYSTIVHPASSTMERNRAVQNLFETVEEVCNKNCDILVKHLAEFNQNFSNDPYERKTELTAMVHKMTETSLNADALGPILKILESAKKIETLYNKNPEAFKTKIQASILALKAIVNFEQEALFKAISKDPQEKSEGIAELKKDLTYLSKQGQGLVKIYNVVSKHNKKAPWTETEAGEIAKAINDLGIFYIKLAQSVSNMKTMLPAEVANAFEIFQDQLPPLPPSDAEAVLTKELGTNPHEIFKDLDLSKPISTGSIAVIYEAKVKNNFGQWKNVVVKVQRPGLKDTLDYNRRLNRLFIQFMKVAGSRVSPAMDFLADQIVGLEDSFETEMDFTKEMRNMQRFAHLFRFNPDVSVPKVYPKYSTKNVLVMEHAEGSNLERSLNKVIAQFKSQGTRESKKDSEEKESLKKTYLTIFESMTYMLFITKEMHADLHPGNMLAVLEEEERGLKLSHKLVMIDYGQTVNTKGFIMGPLMAGYHLMTGNAEGFAKRFIQMGKDPNFPKDQLVAVIEQAFKDHSVEKLSLLDLARRKMKFNNSENAHKALGQILTIAFKDLGYRSNPKYVQVLRTLAPVGNSLSLIGKNLSDKEIAKLSLAGFTRGISLGTLYYLSSILPNTFGDLKYAFEETLRRERQSSNTTAKSNEDFAPGKILTCDRIFAY